MAYLTLNNRFNETTPKSNDKSLLLHMAGIYLSSLALIFIAAVISLGLFQYAHYLIADPSLQAVELYQTSDYLLFFVNLALPVIFWIFRYSSPCNLHHEIN